MNNAGAKNSQRRTRLLSGPLGKGMLAVVGASFALMLVAFQLPPNGNDQSLRVALLASTLSFSSGIFLYVWGITVLPIVQKTNLEQLGSLTKLAWVFGVVLLVYLYVLNIFCFVAALSALTQRVLGGTMWIFPPCALFGAGTVWQCLNLFSRWLMRRARTESRSAFRRRLGRFPRTLRPALQARGQVQNDNGAHNK
jgi:hypothetical protein